MSKLKLGQRADLVREQVGISRTELANLLGLDRSTVTKWSTGHSSPRDIDAVAEALGVPVTRFFEVAAPHPHRKRQRAAA